MITPVDFDDLDEAIISLLQGDGRLSNRAVARELGLSESSIRKRLKRLTDRGAISYGLIVDINATGMSAAGWLTIEVKPSQARKVANFVSAMPLCSMCCITTGQASIRAYIFAEDLEELSKTLQSISSKEGVVNIVFHETFGYTGHRYEMIMFPDSPRGRWAVDHGTGGSSTSTSRPRQY